MDVVVSPTQEIIMSEKHIPGAKKKGKGGGC
jgi:hypothetical protein